MKGLFPFLIISIAALGLLVWEYLRHASVAVGSSVLVAAELLLAVWLFWRRRDELFQFNMNDQGKVVAERTQGDSNTFIFCGTFGLTLAIFAQLAHWPYLGWLALLYWLGAVTYAEFGKPGLVAIRPVLILLIFVHPIPLPCAPWINLTLQSASTSLTMIMLDFLKVFFFTEGNVIGLISQQKLYPELAAGVAWLYPTIYAVIAWGICFRYGWVRTSINICQSLGWVIVGNATCATVLLANKDSGGTWLESPAIVTLLGVIQLALVLFFAWSSDQFLASTQRPKFLDNATSETATSNSTPILSIRWEIQGLQFAIFAGMVFVLALSLRLAPHYHWGVLPTAKQTHLIEIPSEIDSLKIRPATSPPNYTWSELDGIIPMNRPLSSWVIEKDGRKLSLDVIVTGDGSMPHAYPWIWHGWRIKNAPHSLTIGEENGEAMLVDLSRLPGEFCTVIAKGSDQYGSLNPPNSPLGAFVQFPEIVHANFLRALSFRTKDPVTSEFRFPASHTIFLSCLSSKSLETKDLDELKLIWNSVYPVVEQQLVFHESR